MNKLTVTTELRKSEGGIEKDGLVIKIDGVDLMDLIEQSQECIVCPDESLSKNIWCYELSEHDSHLAVNGTTDEKLEIYDCNCGNPGCDPVKLSILLKNGKCIWREFEYSEWNLTNLGPFIFEPQPYLKEIKKLTKNA